MPFDAEQFQLFCWTTVWHEHKIKGYLDCSDSLLIEFFGKRSKGWIAQLGKQKRGYLCISSTHRNNICYYKIEFEKSDQSVL